MLKLFRYSFVATGLFLLMSFTPLHPAVSTKSAGLFSVAAHYSDFDFSKSLSSSAAEIANKYEAWNLGSIGISRSLFNYAIKGYDYLASKNNLRNTDIISIADLSKSSTEKRLYILNIRTGEVLFNTLVAHGKNSGQQYATDFSNEASSFESSLGFYVTTDTYAGKHGYSLRLNGCEKGFNDNACKRAIVVHGADYVSEHFIQQNGYLGRSHGCPAIPSALSKKIIDVIKGGSCLFVYSPSKKYLSRSAILNS